MDKSLKRGSFIVQTCGEIVLKMNFNPKILSVKNQSSVPNLVFFCRLNFHSAVVCKVSEMDSKKYLTVRIVSKYICQHEILYFLTNSQTLVK